MEINSDTKNKQQNIGLKINSLEGKKLILQTFKEMKPNYALNFIGPIGFFVMEDVEVGDVFFEYSVEPHGFEIELKGIWHNYYCNVPLKFRKYM
jgi:hypothetical protein